MDTQSAAYSTYYYDHDGQHYTSCYYYTFLRRANLRYDSYDTREAQDNAADDS